MPGRPVGASRVGHQFAVDDRGGRVGAEPGVADEGEPVRAGDDLGAVGQCHTGEALDGLPVGELDGGVGGIGDTQPRGLPGGVRDRPDENDDGDDEGDDGSR